MSLGITYALITAWIWGCLAIVLKTTLSYGDPVGIVWFRFLFSFLVLLAWFCVFDRKSLSGYVTAFNPKQSLKVVCAGVLLAINYYAYFKGMELTSVNNVQVLVQIGPVLMILMGLFYFRERLLKHQWVGLMAAGFGFLIFYSDQLQELLKDEKTFRAGNAWILLAAVSWAVWGLLQKNLVKVFTPQQTNALIYGIAGLFFTPFVKPSQFLSLTSEQWGVLLGVGAATVIGYGLLAESLKRAPANQVSLLVSLNPLVTLFMMEALSRIGVDWVQTEEVRLRGVVGALMILVGVTIATQPKIKLWLRRPDL